MTALAFRGSCSSRQVKVKRMTPLHQQLVHRSGPAPQRTAHECTR